MDDTLIVPAIATGLGIDTPNYDNINMFRYFKEQGCFMIIWSGGGPDYAQHWAEVLGLVPDEIREKKK